MKSVISNIIGKKIRKIRINKKISVKKLAKKSRLSTSLIHTLERGDYPNSLTSKTINSLAKGLGVGSRKLTSVINMQIGKKIEYLIGSKGENVKDLANYLGCDPSTIYRWEHGTETITTNNLEKLSEYFNIPVNYILRKNIDDETRIKNPIISEKLKVSILGPHSKTDVKLIIMVGQ